MASVKFRDSDGNVYYLNMASGAGTSSDPFVGPGDASATNLPVYVTQSGAGTPQRVIVSGQDECLLVDNCTGTALFVSGSADWPVYIADGGNSITVDAGSSAPLYVKGNDSYPLYVTYVNSSGIPVTNETGEPLWVATKTGNLSRALFVSGSADCPMYIADGGNSITVDAPSPGLYVRGHTSYPVYVSARQGDFNYKTTPVWIAAAPESGLYLNAQSGDPVFVATKTGAHDQALCVSGSADRPVYVASASASTRLYVRTLSSDPLRVEALESSPLYVSYPNSSGVCVTGSADYPIRVQSISTSGEHTPTRPLMARYEEFTMNAAWRQSAKTVFATGEIPTKINTPDRVGGHAHYSKVILKAPTSNDVAIWIAGNSGNADVSGSYAFPIYPGDSHEFNSVDLGLNHYGQPEAGGHANNSLYIYAD